MTEKDDPFDETRRILRKAPQSVFDVSPFELGGAEGLTSWWSEAASGDLTKTLPKVEEYSASDLLTMGTSLRPNGTDAERIEIGIAIYVLGKAARIVGALTEGKRPSDDSWQDVTVYSMMGRYAREFGRWP
jgi:hypothetical protein